MLGLFVGWCFYIVCLLSFGFESYGLWLIFGCVWSYDLVFGGFWVGVLWLGLVGCLLVVLICVWFVYLVMGAGVLVCDCFSLVVGVVVKG